ncbi:MAG: glycosyltransferase family 2 protein [Candidatus Stahlbacteria bacterium]|nr:glycosyltransferase family 2 protein [Candidatus Stahlbacteria bacterium]
MSISIIIVTWNSEEYIEACLYSLDPQDEIIVIDNASKDKTVEKVNTLFSTVQMIRNSQNIGLSRAINQGAKIATGEYILLLNPDVVVMEDTIAKMCKFMLERSGNPAPAGDDREDIGACAPRFLWPNGSVQRSCRELPTFKNLFIEFTGIGRLKKCPSWKMWNFNYTETKEVEQPMGSCLMIRKQVFDEIGGMNERYPIFMNDVDLCYRIKKAGYKIYFIAHANVIHYLGSSTRKVKRKMIIEEHRSMYRYLRDHFNNRCLVVLYGIILLTGAFARSLFSRVKSGNR